MSWQRTWSGVSWEREYGYCRAIRAGDLVFVTGTAPVDEAGATHAPGDPYEQARRCYEIIGAALADLGAGATSVVRTRMYVTDIAHADAFGRAHRDFFAGHAPCLTMVEIKGLIDPEMLIEIEADAVTG